MAMRNEDFRKLLAETPRRSTAVADTPARLEGSQNHSFTHKKKKFFPPNKHNKAKKTEEDKEADEEALRLKKILENYRDRAAERRDKGNEEMDEMTKLTAAYRAVPGDSRGATDKAYARMQAIEESKFLGGDIEHTHLVKGLDYSLLHKVRSEIDRTKGDEDEGEKMEMAYKQAEAQAEQQAPPRPSDNRMVKNIQTILFKNELPVRNDSFKKGRMAYVVEMEEETESEVPTTLLRSLIDCPNNESNSNINANNMLISKLTQVLSYLRADHKKKKKPEMSEDDVKKYQSQNIFDNEAEYAPKKERERREERRDTRKTESYFGDGERRREHERREHRDYDRRDRRRDDYDRRDRDREREKRERELAEKEKKLEEKMEKRRKEAEDGGYDECYPGGLAELGGNWGDSDDEEDMTKMDLGNKKSGIKRWDFDNDEDYEKFQGGREAMPKAAYQFGVKPQDGRKTRKSVDNKKLDRELGQIEKINEKRKATIKEGGEYKRPKY